jgi:hypothetical protein
MGFNMYPEYTAVISLNVVYLLRILRRSIGMKFFNILHDTQDELRHLED